MPRSQRHCHLRVTYNIFACPFCHLTVLAPGLCSGLEDSRLNYVEQHAARLGLDATRLESARVSAAQGGPVGDTLDVCARCLDGTTFGELAPTLAGLVRRGVGLNTRAGAGRFVAQVARRLGADSAAGAPPLMRALQEACKAERSPVVRRAYASANAVLAKYAAQSRVDRDVTAWLEGATSEESDSATRLTSGLMLRALAREAGDVFAAHAPAVAPVAYIAQFDSDAGVKEVWTEIWEESTTSAGAGLRIHMRAALDQALKLLKSAQWGTKAAGAAAVARASEAAGDAVAPHAPEVLAALLAELPGRLWDGKEAVLAALGAVVAAAGDGLTAADSEAGGRVVAAMLEAAAKKKSVYRKEALVQLKKGGWWDLEGRWLLGVVWGASVRCTRGACMHGRLSCILLQFCLLLFLMRILSCLSAVLEVLKDPKFLPSVVPPMSAICDEYLTTAGTKAPEANGTTGNGVPDESKPVPPFAEAMGCLGAAWRVGGISSGTAWISEGVAAAASGISGSASKIGDQTAALDAALCLARRCAELSGEGGDNGSLIDPGSDDGRTLLAAAARVAEEGKSAAIRELALELLSSLLRQSWRGMGEAEQKDWHGVVARIAEKDKLPVVRSQAATLAMELSTLQAS